jgi:hypothetical protein
MLVLTVPSFAVPQALASVSIPPTVSSFAITQALISVSNHCKSSLPPATPLADKIYTGHRFCISRRFYKEYTSLF